MDFMFITKFRMFFLILYLHLSSLNLHTHDLVDFYWPIALFLASS